MTIQADSAKTSVSPCALLSPIFHRRESISNEFQISPTVIAHPRRQVINFVDPGSDLSAHRYAFNANLVVSNFDGVSVIDAQRDANTFFIFAVSSPAPAAVVKAESNIGFRRSSHLSKTNDSWVLWNDFDLEATKSLAELRSIISGIELGFVPQRSGDFEDLLGRALSAKGRPDDVEQWARRLAQDISNLDD